ncbi:MULTISPECIES: LysR family transcriptional regulator [Oceanobacillus]|uniref:LysR family transcriptional regulator n=1 Tax=Oceanobacillus profundus TaxID=372463 RepID=A0A417YA41_9BACI|nr:LysR family transcriptional regulator [Oceanobacillus profundus]MBR3117934.1 LysR family transcriptional regulator [Oceanobacillus sp.]PAE28550.1 LysR family transcriptional regulator [Paenibacillus sp. 7884-2]MCM3397329.1 LysR family transcriptional regulator [Oceanobacillus profundus]MDO6449574.1 LysR family transcriptional regulator [Oceanobacillus profundus]RHW29394.1 LysR family transcriptional regulator [Oceanobacillus profundus]
MDQHLIVFKEVAQRKNFSRAAKELHMSQPAVSQYIAALEKELGVRLLERSNKFVELNRAGEIVYQYAQKILRNYDQMRILVSDLENEPSGQLKIGASYTIGEYVLPRFLAKLQEEFPNIIPTVTIGNTEDIGAKLVQHEIDIGLVEGNFTHHQVSTRQFATDEMYIIAGTGQSFKEEACISIKDLENETWIIREEGSGTRKMLEDFFQRSNLEPKRILTFGSTQTIKEGVESGLGISLLSNLTFKKEQKLKKIQRIFVEGTPIKRKFSIIKNYHEFQPKALQVFENLVKQEA